jgi:hypothetical protein
MITDITCQATGGIKWFNVRVTFSCNLGIAAATTMN